MIDTLNTTEQLIDIYLNRMDHDIRKMPYESCLHYFNTLLRSGNIILHIVQDKVVGYVEFWCINRTQLERIMQGKRFDADGENINHGRLCFVSDVWSNDKRTLSILKRKLFEVTNHCSIYMGVDHKRGKRKEDKFRWFFNKSYIPRRKYATRKN